MPIFMREGGYGAFVPAMLVYHENTTPNAYKCTIRIFILVGGYGAFVPAMLVWVVLSRLFITNQNTCCHDTFPLLVIPGLS